MWLSRWGHGGRVIAFEPQRDLAGRLVCACESIGLRNVQVEAKAVSAAPGVCQLFIPDGHQPGASLKASAVANLAYTKASVPVVALDDFFPESDRVSFLKVDVEGAELDVFRGAERILDRDKPLLLFECEGRHLNGAAVVTVLSYLRMRGYDGKFVSNGKLLPQQLSLLKGISRAGKSPADGSVRSNPASRSACNGRPQCGCRPAKRHPSPRRSLSEGSGGREAGSDSPLLPGLASTQFQTPQSRLCGLKHGVIRSPHQT